MVVCKQDLALFVSLILVLRKGDGSLKGWWIPLDSCPLYNSFHGVAEQLKLTVAYFPPVPFDGTDFIASDIVLGIHADAHELAAFPSQLLHECHPNLLSFVVGEVAVEKLHVDP